MTRLAALLQRGVVAWLVTALAFETTLAGQRLRKRHEAGHLRCSICSRGLALVSRYSRVASWRWCVLSQQNEQKYLNRAHGDVLHITVCHGRRR
jgi:hypothetical protein